MAVGGPRRRPGAARRLGATIGRGALLAALLLLPGACSLFQKDGPPPPCPTVARPSETDHLTRFDGSGRDLTDVVFKARLRDVKSSCEYHDDDTRLEGDLLITFEIERGPALRRLQAGQDSNAAGFSYFVAVATNADQPKILSRQAFDVNATFEGNNNRVALTDEIAPQISLKPGEDGSNYRIYVGIELNHAELDYNRQNQ
ncbi:hypothetical protein SAMN06265365_101687 [Tistlia consotensis]|uniref:Uncharacterized protein n=2 Tax=Tistlia TaxID=1321364 RepID=A0A1Y6BBB1_9PROT|nr:hypothetical protein SAMN05428998_101686 [Tistlia consotensis USBA 355]SNR29372.1 hypothetical protein SAMN06265365_101687 [Tistlia consotensis]